MEKFIKYELRREKEITMATIKSYSDLQQSKRLAEILPLESADMTYLSEESLAPKVNYCGMVFFNSKEEKPSTLIPCWSLAALLGVIPEYNLQRTDWGNKTEYKIVVTVNDDNYASKNYDNPLDACVAMIELLHEQKLL